MIIPRIKLIRVDIFIKNLLKIIQDYKKSYKTNYPTICYQNYITYLNSGPNVEIYS